MIHRPTNSPDDVAIPWQGIIKGSAVNPRSSSTESSLDTAPTIWRGQLPDWLRNKHEGYASCIDSFQPCSGVLDAQESSACGLPPLLNATADQVLLLGEADFPISLYPRPALGSAATWKVMSPILGAKYTEGTLWLAGWQSDSNQIHCPSASCDNSHLDVLAMMIYSGTCALNCMGEREAEGH